MQRNVDDLGFHSFLLFLLLLLSLLYFFAPPRTHRIVLRVDTRGSEPHISLTQALNTTNYNRPSTSSCQIIGTGSIIIGGRLHRDSQHADPVDSPAERHTRSQDRARGVRVLVSDSRQESDPFGNAFSQRKSLSDEPARTYHQLMFRRLPGLLDYSEPPHLFHLRPRLQDLRKLGEGCMGNLCRPLVLDLPGASRPNLSVVNPAPTCRTPKILSLM